MFQDVLSAHLVTLCVLLAPLGTHATDLYVATNGTASGSGTMGQPYDLATALSGQVGQAGDTFWLREGNYVLGHIDTQIEGAPGQPVTFRQMPGERARVDGSISFFNSSGYVVLRDFELYSSDTNRASAQTGVGFEVTDISIIPGIASYAPNLSFINLIVHDHTRHGFYISNLSSNNLIYGCVVYNSGWVSPDNAEGHGVHARGAYGTEIADNVVFNNSGANMHIYDNTVGNRLVGLTLDGNVAFNAGAIQNVRAYSDWIVGVDAPADDADGIVLKNNMGYYSPGSPTYKDVQIGREGINGSVILTDNYMRLGLKFNNWSTATVSGNVFGSGQTDYLMDVNQRLTSLEAAWDGNTYLSATTSGDFIWNSERHSFPEWRNVTGFDGTSSYVGGSPTGTKVFVRSNRYESGRANIVVYNWDNAENVSIDVSSVLARGTAYEVRNAQDFIAGPVLSGVFDGQPLDFPLTGLTVGAPNGPFLTPPPTGPAFSVFVLLPCFNKLRIQWVNGIIKVYWPTNRGSYVLQFKDHLSGNTWRDMEVEAAVEGDQYVITDDTAGATRFYRLRTRG
jgi:hypothetical protein